MGILFNSIQKYFLNKIIASTETIIIKTSIVMNNSFTITIYKPTIITKASNIAGN
ncbi:MAG: hypothetical protein LBQ24_07960 [Candidatus Peribacteria bacterium]|jgi:hypothetical protein|nr:hypothetical protein [Candidatus Peribacteria bacterium]